MSNSPKPQWKEKLNKANEKEVSPYRQLILQTITTALLTTLIASIPMAMLAYHLSSLTEKQKGISADEKLYLEQRMKLFIATGEHFEAYQLNWSRLIVFANYEWERLKHKQPLTEKELENKKKYSNDRDKAKDLLFADLTAARLFFSDDVVRLIDTFKTFDGKQHDKTVDKLPLIEEWGKHQKAILDAMRKEVRRK